MITITERLRSYLKLKIEDITDLPVAWFRANDNTQMPYVVLDIQDLTINNFNTRQIDLTAEFWERNNPKDIIKACDDLAYAFKHYSDMTDYFSVQIYTDTQAGWIDDTDKDIYRLMARYEVHLTPRED